MGAPQFPIQQALPADVTVGFVHKLDYVREGLGRFLEQYKGKPRINALAQVYLEEIQELEDAIWSVFVGRWLANAEGVQLDTLGKIVGQLRNGQSDAVYKIYIGVKIKVNRSNGTAPNLLEIAHLILDPLRFAYTEEANATTVFKVSDPLPDRSVLLDLLTKAKAGGVRVLVESNLGGSSTAFRFSATSSSHPGSAHGFNAGALMGVSSSEYA